MNKKTLLITGTSGFIGYNFLKYILSKKYYVIDILRLKNKNNRKLNILRKEYPKNYKTIFFSNNHQLEKKIKKIKIDYFINFATLYKNNHNYKDIFNFVDSNILFPTLIYDLICNKIKKIINFGSMMQYKNSTKLTSQNLYAATKNSFEMINNYYQYKNKNISFYNLKLYESYGENDYRNKLIPTIIKNYRLNKVTKILSKKLELNIIHVNDIVNAIMILLNNNIKPGTYCLKQKKNIKIKKLIETLNTKLTKKIKIKYQNQYLEKVNRAPIEILPKWIPDDKLIKKIGLNFYNENN